MLREGDQSTYPGADVSGLGRPLDLSYPSNLAVVCLALLAAGWSLGARHGAWHAAQSAGAAFTSWTLAREIDPDHPESAVLAALAMVPVTLYSPSTSLVRQAAASGGATMIARAIAGTSGRPLRTADLATLTGATLGLLWASHAEERERSGTLPGLAALVALALRPPGPAVTETDTGTPLDARRVALARTATLAIAAFTTARAPRAATALAVAAGAVALAGRGQAVRAAWAPRSSASAAE